MRLRLLPSDTAVFVDLARLADTVVEGANALAELFGTEPTEREAIRCSLLECDRRAYALTGDVMVRLNGTFVPPFDREDVYSLASAMVRCLKQMAAAGDLVVVFGVGKLPPDAVALVAILVRQGELTARAMRRLGRLKDLAGYWVEIHRLENEAARTYRRLLKEVFEDDTDLPRMLKLREVVHRLDAAVDGFQSVARLVETISIKET